MTITKFGHCCLLIEEGRLRILLDPGNLSEGQNSLANIDVVLITHEHQDHCHTDSVKEVVRNNPGVKIYTNTSVVELLKKEGVVAERLEDGMSVEEKGVLIEGFGKDHALMHASWPTAHNVGYFIANRFFYPGDSFTNPGKSIEVLALPVAGPWMKLTEAIDYALALKPKTSFPVHEGILKTPGSTHLLPSRILPPAGVPFQILEIGQKYEF